MNGATLILVLIILAWFYLREYIVDIVEFLRSWLAGLFGMEILQTKGYGDRVITRKDDIKKIGSLRADEDIDALIKGEESK